MSRATDDAFDALHGLMAESMTEELKRGLRRAEQPKRICVNNEWHDNPDYEPLSPKLLGVIRAFLKDNGIDSPAAAQRFDGIVGKLRDLDPDDLAGQQLN